MSVCNNCGKSMLFGGRKIDGVTYCGGPCATSHTTWLAAGRVPADVLQQVVERERLGACPRCKKNNGPIDVHEAHRVHSFLIMTQWHTKAHIACRPCGRKLQAGGLVYSLLLGWWGMPWGLLVTPMQIFRNVGGMVAPTRDKASPAFERLIRRQMAVRQLEIEQAQGEMR